MTFVTSFLKKIESDTSSLFLINAKEDGLECWHYINADKVKIPLLKQKLKQTPCTLDLNDYGKVIRSGWGKEPKPEVKAQIESGDFTPPKKDSEYKVLWLNNEQDGKPFHAFIAVKWELAEKFEYMANHIGNMNLEEWGVVMEIGWGPAPQDRIDYFSNLENA